MVLTSSQKNVIDQIMQVVMSKQSRGRRIFATEFLELVSKEDYPEYYDAIPNPRCLNKIRQDLQADVYTDPLDAYNDIALVFWNALYYNEEGSAIAKDAQVLKDLLDNEWRRHNVLPHPKMAPPPNSAQKLNQSDDEAPSQSIARTPVSVDVEIDIEGGGDDRVFRDKASEELITRLDNSLPKWPGFGENGWWNGEKSSLDVLNAIKSHKDIIGNLYAPVLDSIPEQEHIDTLPFTTPLSLNSIETRANSGEYKSFREFDHDMSALFMKARRWYDIGSEFYGQVVLLQRLYQALTSDTPPSGPPCASSINFAALPAGPGTALPSGSNGAGVPGVTHNRIPSKDRTFLEMIHYKGWDVKVGDWLHLANPNDPCRPIVGQVWRCWTSVDGKKKGVTVIWYFRPEQTFHTADRKFWQNEIFKTNEYVEHPLEDIIEKIFVQPTSQHIRGRPRAPHWYPGFPLYLCDAKYSPSDRAFQVIKNWNACLPEEIRPRHNKERLYEFERTIYVAQYESPLLGRGKGKAKDIGRFPGGLVPAALAGPGILRQTMPMNPQAQIKAGNASGTIVASVGNASSHVIKLSPDLTRHFNRHQETNELLWFPGPPAYVAASAKPKHSLAYLHFLAMKRKQEDSWDGQEDGAKKARRE